MDIISPPVNHRKINNQYLTFNVHISIDMFTGYGIREHTNKKWKIDTVESNLILGIDRHGVIDHHEMKSSRKHI